MVEMELLVFTFSIIHTYLIFNDAGVEITKFRAWNLSFQK